MILFVLVLVAVATGLPSDEDPTAPDDRYISNTHLGPLLIKKLLLKKKHLLLG
jgi:hypothetical protein